MTLGVYESTLKFLGIVSKDKLEESERELNKRYAQCDSGGHIGPRIEDVCQYCYRHYEYKSRIHPMNASGTQQKIIQDIELQRAQDRFTGLSKILTQF